MPVSPLMPPENLAKINDALNTIDNALREAELAARAGIDVTTQVASLKASQGKLLAIKNVYFPGQ